MSRVYYGYWIVAAGFITQFVAVGMANYVVGSFLIPMTEEFAWSRAEFTAARSIGQVVLATTGFLIGTHIDRWGGRPFIVVGALGAVCSHVSALAVSIPLGQWLLINGLMLTMGSAMIGNLVVNVTLGKWFVEKRGKAVALAGMGISLSWHRAATSGHAAGGQLRLAGFLGAFWAWWRCFLPYLLRWLSGVAPKILTNTPMGIVTMRWRPAKVTRRGWILTSL
jgi:hypothetical protein